MTHGTDYWRDRFKRTSDMLETLREAANTEQQGQYTQAYIAALRAKIDKLQSDAGWARDRTEWGR